MPDVVAPKAHQNKRSLVNLPSDSLCKNLAWWAVTHRNSKNHKTVKIGGGVAQVWALARDNTLATGHGLLIKALGCGSKDPGFQSH